MKFKTAIEGERLQAPRIQRSESAVGCELDFGDLRRWQTPPVDRHTERLDLEEFRKVLAMKRFHE
jgi:hypothetical protein